MDAQEYHFSVLEEQWLRGVVGVVIKTTDFGGLRPLYARFGDFVNAGHWD